MVIYKRLYYCISSDYHQALAKKSWPRKIKKNVSIYVILYFKITVPLERKIAVEKKINEKVTVGNKLYVRNTHKDYNGTIKTYKKEKQILTGSECCYKVLCFWLIMTSGHMYRYI